MQYCQFLAEQSIRSAWSVRRILFREPAKLLCSNECAFYNIINNKFIILILFIEFVTSIMIEATFWLTPGCRNDSHSIHVFLTDPQHTPRLIIRSLLIHFSIPYKPPFRSYSTIYHLKMPFSISVGFWTVSSVCFISTSPKHKNHLLLSFFIVIPLNFHTPACSWISFMLFRLVFRVLKQNDKTKATIIQAILRFMAYLQTSVREIT